MYGFFRLADFDLPPAGAGHHVAERVFDALRRRKRHIHLQVRVILNHRDELDVHWLCRKLVEAGLSEGPGQFDFAFAANIIEDDVVTILNSANWLPVRIGQDDGFE